MSACSYLPRSQSLAYESEGKLIIETSGDARKDGNGFSYSYQPQPALLARPHALRFVFVHYPQEKPVDVAESVVMALRKELSQIKIESSFSSTYKYVAAILCPQQPYTFLSSD